MARRGQNEAQNGPIFYLGENLIFETPLTRNQGFWGPRPPQNGTKKRLKNELETRALKIRRFSALGGPRQCPGTPRRGPFYAKTASFLGCDFRVDFFRAFWEILGGVGGRGRASGEGEFLF